MEETRTKIAECKQARVEIDTELRKQFGVYGRALWESDHPPEQTLEEFVQIVADRQKALGAVEKDIRDIQQAREAADTAKDEIARIEQRLASIEFEKNSLYSRIGVISYEEYAAGEIGEEFSLMFSAITHQNAELSRLQKQLKENELKHVAASFFEKMSLKMKRNKLKAEMEKLEASREELFSNAGRQISDSDLMELVKSKNAHTISQDFKRLDQERDRMYALLESKKFDYNRSQDILDQSGAESDAQKKIKELEKKLVKAERELGGALEELGKAAYDLDSCRKRMVEEPKAADALEQIDGLLARRSQLDKQLAYLDAKVRIKELESAIDVDHQKEQRVSSQISSLNDQLKEIDQRIQQTRKQIRELGEVLEKNRPADGAADERLT
jgi:DNA repair exonuclease SbcCD ATPase subunit